MRKKRLWVSTQKMTRISRLAYAVLLARAKEANKKAKKKVSSIANELDKIMSFETDYTTEFLKNASSIKLIQVFDEHGKECPIPEPEMEQEDIIKMLKKGVS